MTTNTRSIGRRAFLRGLTAAGGAMVGLPLLDAMMNDHGTAMATGEPLPLRLGTFFWGNGIRPGDWTPAVQGPGWAPTPNLQPIHDAGVVADVAVVSGLGHASAVGCHNPGRALMLSGSWDGTPFDGSAGRSSATLPSVDQLAADHFASLTTFPSLELAISKAGITGQDTFGCAWRDGNLLPAETSPRALFDRLFLGFSPDDSVRIGRLSVLDAVLDDAEALRGRLGASDRQRLEAHLEALYALEVRVEAEPPVCAIPAAPIDPAEERLMERTSSFAEILAMALVCDLTRVFSIRFTQSVGDTVFTDVGAAEGHHTLSHTNMAMHSATVTHTVACFCELVRRFGEQVEGEGRLLDRCALMAVSDLADGSTHTVEDLPVLVAGQAGGALVTGQHLRDASGSRASIVPFTLLRAVGVDASAFGTGEGEVTQTLSGLTA
ncbi:DUF1552 domain-containing protein [Paraliomyxa miuraensis]|uniref:DUF1552 domain-containing protein n=1 Tax=Paraliomyxa miuraensis TaxID=376150 RepID=UPI00225A0283|nr:DUF1552 domain-containing protein [Paraliomyxa miuraensis]MCX4242450.1 DUF1552 domain-containing protein [Paraliomyxa miuraensis]